KNCTQAVDVQSVGLWDFPGIHGQVVGDLLIDEGLDSGQLLDADRRIVREVESRLVGIDERAFLLKMLTGGVKDFAQGPVEEMSGSVILHDRRAAIAIDFGAHALADSEWNSPGE